MLLLSCEVESKAVPDEGVVIEGGGGYLEGVKVDGDVAVEFLGRGVPDDFIMGEVVQHFEEEGEAGFALLVVANVLVEHSDLPPAEEAGECLPQSTLHP